jgi:hypothetical protein
MCFSETLLSYAHLSNLGRLSLRQRTLAASVLTYRRNAVLHAGDHLLDGHGGGRLKERPRERVELVQIIGNQAEWRHHQGPEWPGRNKAGCVVDIPDDTVEVDNDWQVLVVANRVPRIVANQPVVVVAAVQVVVSAL